MSEEKTIERFFPESTIGLVSPGGTDKVPRQKGVHVHLHWRANEENPCMAEVFSDDCDNTGLHAEVGLWFEGKKLSDYDGVYELPGEVVGMLKELGYDLSYVEDDE